MFKLGDLVIIVDEIPEYIYRLISIDNDTCQIVGYIHRINKIVNISRLAKASVELIKKHDELKKRYFQKACRNFSTRSFPKALFGRILHIDGDESYLESCLELYDEVGIFAEGIYINEKDPDDIIEKLVLNVTPDIIIITGHDTFNGEDIKDIRNYENSQSFVKTIRKLRKHFSYQDLIIIAGACSSHFEALIGAGANFASSPKRINSHTYDPAIVAIKIASTSFTKNVDFDNILKYIENGRDAIGGIETKGKMRLLL